MRQNLVQKHTEKIKLLKLFEESIKSAETRRAYKFYLKKYMDYLGPTKFKALLQESDPKKIEQSIIDFIISKKKEGKGYSAIHNYISATFAFYKINDVVLNTDKINRFMPENRKSNKDRSYTHQEIHRLLEVSDERMKAVILLSCSSGMRIGAIPSLRIRNLEKISMDPITSIYKIIVYENDREEHFTYCTPECLKAIDQYLEMRKRYGEEINENSFLIREQFDIRDPFAISRPVKTLSHTLGNKIGELAVRCGIRGKVFLEESKKHLGSTYRKDVPIAHGFRKLFTTQLVNLKINPEIREMLLGHKIGLASAYYKPSDDDFLIEYQKAINHLTINEEFKLKMQVKKLEIEKSQLEKIAQDVAMLKRRMRK